MTTETAQVFAPLTQIAYKENAINKQFITKNASGHILLFAFDQGQALKEHTAPADAIVQVIEGQAEFHIAGTPYQVNAGEMIILPGTIPHAVAAVSAFKMLLTMIKE